VHFFLVCVHAQMQYTRTFEVQTHQTWPQTRAYVELTWSRRKAIEKWSLRSSWRTLSTTTSAPGHLHRDPSKTDEYVPSVQHEVNVGRSREMAWVEGQLFRSELSLRKTELELESWPLKYPDGSNKLHWFVLGRIHIPWNCVKLPASRSTWSLTKLCEWR